MNYLIILLVAHTAFANYPKINAQVVGVAQGKSGVNIGAVITDKLTAEQRARISDYKRKNENVHVVASGNQVILRVASSGDIFLRDKKIGRDSELADVYILTFGGVDEVRNE